MTEKIPVSGIQDDLAARFGAAESRARSLIARTDNITAVEDDDAEEQVTQAIADMLAAHKDAESHRTAEKAPYIAGGKAVDGYFKTKILTPLETRGKILRGLLTGYQLAKAEAERERRRQEERRLREEAEQRAREAREREEAAKTEDDLDDAIDAAERAEQAASDAAKAEKDASAKAADMHRARTEAGSVASLRTVWRHDEASLSREGLDLEALRPYLPMPALHQAVRAYVKAGNRELRGVIIREHKETVVR